MSGTTQTRSTVAWSELVKARGWTDSLIKRHLGDPDELKTNPYHRSGPPMRLFLIQRVEEVEMHSEVAAALEKVAERRPQLSAAAKAAADSKRDELLHAVGDLNIEVPRLDLNDLFRRAIRSYNELWANRGEASKYADSESDPDFLCRIAANYVRHNLVDYDRILRALGGKVGKAEAYYLFKDRVMKRIFEVYPELSASEPSAALAN